MVLLTRGVGVPVREAVPFILRTDWGPEGLTAAKFAGFSPADVSSPSVT
jgi:hypothetical protein